MRLQRSFILVALCLSLCVLVLGQPPSTSRQKGLFANRRPSPTIGGFEGARPLSMEGLYDTYFGMGAGASNTTGEFNCFFGSLAGWQNSSGSANSVFGAAAGSSTSTGQGNSFFGRLTGRDNNTGELNSFFGREAGLNSTIGHRNTFIGSYAGWRNTIESNNTLIGAYADFDPGLSPTSRPVNNATAIGYRAYVSRGHSVVLGAVNGVNGATAETFVGIGTTRPDRQLVVEGSQALGKFRRFNENGPDFAPAFLFERARGTNLAPVDMVPGDYLGKLQFRGMVTGEMLEYGALTFIASDTSQNGRFAFVDRDMVTERMVVLNTGSVGIGTTAPTERLDVDGNLRVRGGISYGAAGVSVPDYVFEPGFPLMPILELEQYVRRERHLPNIPDASEIQGNGVNLGEFQMKLLEKVEELTLYTAEQARLIKRQKEEAAAFKEQAVIQNDRITALEQTVKALLKDRDERTK